MPEQVAQQAGKLTIEPEFRAARLPDDRRVVFTRSESRALAHLVRNAERLVSRGQLLDAVDEPGSGKNDRNIDFLVNRLRRKLGDDAKAPRYIATRYGEGYVWIGVAVVDEALPDKAFLVVGPLRGLDHLDGLDASARDFARELFRAIRSHAAEHQHVVFAPGYAPIGPTDPQGPEIAVELTFFHDRGEAGCVVAARCRRSGQIVDVSRHAVQTGPQAAALHAGTARTLAPGLLAKAWRTRTAAALGAAPLPVAMHDAADRPQQGGESWKVADRRLRALRAEHPDDPEYKLMYATHLHTKYILRGMDLFLSGTAECRKDEAEIERLVLDSIGFAQSRPDYAITAAKLLYFVDAGYRDLSVGMMETAHRSHGVIAASLATVGQMRAFLGETDAALECLHQAVALAAPKSEFRLYALTMLCQALQAADDREGLAVARREICASSLGAAFLFDLFLADPDAPSLRARSTAALLSRARAQAILSYLHYIWARLLVRQAHRENALRGPLRLLVRRFGPTVVPPQVARLVPALIK